MLPASFAKFNKKFQTDFVLVSNIPQADSENPDEFSEKRLQRSIFLENLKKEGLKIQTRKLDDSDLVFDLICAPRRVLERYAEILKIKMPLKTEYCDTVRLTETASDDELLVDHFKEETKSVLDRLSFFIGNSDTLQMIKDTLVPSLERIKVNWKCIKSC